MTEARSRMSSAVVEAPAGPADENYLHEVGTRVRALRNARGMTRRQLSIESGVSERYLAQLEAGDGNISIRLMRRVARALDSDVGELAAERPMPLELKLLVDALAQLPGDRIVRARQVLFEELDRHSAVRRRRIALIGLRGAGKSTLGRRLADALGVSFIELEREVERDLGAPLDEILTSWGAQAYRDAERKALDRVLRQHVRVVIAASSAIVNDRLSYEMLRQGCVTVWLKAPAQECVERASQQGDSKPRVGRDSLLAEARSLASERENQFRMADMSLDTSGKSVDQSFDQLAALFRTTH